LHAGRSFSTSWRKTLEGVSLTMMSGGLEIHFVDAGDRLRALEPEWRELYENSVPRNPCLSPEWCLACWEHAGDAGTPFVVTARRDGRLVGMAPLRMEHRRGVRVLGYFGARWSTYFALLLAPGEPGVERALLNALAQATDHWDIILLRDVTDGYTKLLEAELPAGLSRASGWGDTAPHLNLKPGWEALLREGPPQLRHSRRPARRWEREGGTVERVTGAAAAELLPEITALEALSWKAEEGVPQFQRPYAQRLWQELLSQLGGRGELELWLGRIQGKLAAFQINLVAADRLWFYYGAYDPAFRAYYPGGVVHYRIIEDACRRGFREYDFMVGSEPYKQGWTDSERLLRIAAIYPRSARGYLAFALTVGPQLRLRESQTGRKVHKVYRILRWRRQALLPLLLGRRARAH
jgi:CelD/BcsL family acetyltransferase involved in cellulose biosynthesis